MASSEFISWRAYKALWVAGGLSAGIALAAWVPGSHLAPWLLLIVLGAVAVSISWRMGRNRLVTSKPLLQTGAAALVLMALGGALYDAYQALPNDHLAHRLYAGQWLGDDVWLEGRIVEDPAADAHAVRFTLAARRIMTPADTLEVSGLVRVTVRSASDTAATPSRRLAPGDVLRLRGLLRPLPQQRNPADFDYGRYLQRRGIYALLTATAPDDVEHIAQAHSSAGVTALRAYVREHLAHLTHNATARSVLAALILGERHHLDDALRERFVRTGLMHLLAVSGLHVLLVGYVLYRLLQPWLLRLRLSRTTVEVVRSLITLLLLGLYVVLTGAPPSVVRAAVMGALMMGGVLLQRKVHPLNTLGTAGLVILMARPTQLFEPGFQLSFAAVAAIVMLCPVFSSWLPARWQEGWFRHGIADPFAASLAATLGTAPVLLFHFGHVSFAGLVLNIVAIPLTMLGLGAALLALVLASPLPVFAGILGRAAEGLIRSLVETAHLGDLLLSWASVNQHVTDEWVLMGMVAGLLTLAHVGVPQRRWRLTALMLILLTAGLWNGVLSSSPRPHLEVLFFDVSQGDAALLTLPNGRHLLVDAGPRDHYVDQGTRTLLPHLRRYGISYLDAVVITHAHSDHLGGLPALLRGVSVGRVLHNGQSHDSALYAETMALIDSLQVPHQAVHAGDTLLLDPSVRLQVLAPLPHRATDGANDASVVLRVTFGQTAWLFTGDAEQELEDRLVACCGPLLRSDVVKVGHHGSKTSSTAAFVEAAIPDTHRAAIAVVSVARRNPFGLPSPGVLARWKRRGAAVHTTAAEGAIWLCSDGVSVEHMAWR